MRCPIRTRDFVVVLAVVAFLVFLFFIVGFFVNVNSTISDTTWGDMSWWLQPEYNFLHGRAYQHSINHMAVFPEIGIVKNPDAYINLNSGHTNVTNFAISLPFYALVPNVNTLLAVVIAFNYAGALFFSYKIIKHLSKNARFTRTALVWALLLSSSFLGVIQYKAHATLYAGPLVLAAYYSMLKRRYWWFLPTIVGIALISEDCAMFLASFGTYLLFFEGKEARAYAWTSMGIGVGWLLIVLTIVQPAARAHMVVSTGATATGMLAYAFAGMLTLQSAVQKIIRFKELFLFLPAFVLVRLLYGRIARPTLKKAVGLIVVAPASHWLITFIQGPGHHLMPILVAAFLGLTIVVGGAEVTDEVAWVRSKVACLSAAVAVFFVLSNAVVMRYNVPIYMQPAILNALGKQSQAVEIDKDISQIPSNRYFIATVTQTIPVDKSVSYLANRTVEAFICNRSDIWRFPDYYRDVDYIAVQKNARHAFFALDTNRPDLSSAIGRGAQGENFKTTQRDTDAIVNELVVRDRAYEVVLDDDRALVLRRLKPANIPMPSYTYGLGFLTSKIHGFL
jgi:hypothetical protein